MEKILTRLIMVLVLRAPRAMILAGTCRGAYISYKTTIMIVKATLGAKS